MSSDIIHGFINHFSGVYYATQEWWLSESSTPQPLFMMRAAAGTASFIAMILSFYNALHPNELEHTWDDSTFTRFRVISFIQAIGFMLLSLYYLAAALLEVDRTTSPHRLLVLGAAVTVMVTGYLMSAVFWRTHYIRKRSKLSKEGEDVQIK